MSSDICPQAYLLRKGVRNTVCCRWADESMLAIDGTRPSGAKCWCSARSAEQSAADARAGGGSRQTLESEIPIAPVMYDGRLVQAQPVGNLGRRYQVVLGTGHAARVDTGMAVAGRRAMGEGNGPACLTCDDGLGGKIDQGVCPVGSLTRDNASDDDQGFC